jgi:acyl transferase domain-containing protein/phosphopantetheinyl transferase/acyl carrier protein
VAIIGMACTYPGSRNLAEFWRNIITGRDCIVDVPRERWNPDVFHDPRGSFEDRIYTKKGGFLGVSFAFNPLRYGTMPKAVEGAEPDQFLVLRTVHEAMDDAGYLNGEIDGERAAFILGRGNYLGAGVGGLLQRGMMTEQTLHIIRRLHPELTAAQMRELKRAIRSKLPGFAPECAPGLIPNITTGRVANRLDLMGPTYTVDAACASSLIATDLAVRDLLDGRYDLMIAGGAHICSEVPFLQVFAAMGALSRSSCIRPFDQDCDGTLAGEGVGILILKRLEDAERDGDRIYAVIRGVGTSSDGRAKGVTAPRREGEELALRRAYEMCGVPPETVELIEAHGTGTPVGDPTEIEAMMQVFGPRNGGPPNCAIGSIKSMIGHTMPAAGAAGMIKAALALYHKVLPPTLNCRRPLELLFGNDCRFYVNSETRPWIHGGMDYPRRAGVNAFGFGGVNAHVVLEEYLPHTDVHRGAVRHHRADAEGRHTPTLAADLECELVVVEGDNRESLCQSLRRLAEYTVAAPGVALADMAYTANTGLTGRPLRLAVVASSPADLAGKLTRAADRLIDPKCRQIRDSQGIYFFEDQALREGKTAFLFPGEGSQYVNMMADLCIHFPQVRAVFEAADQGEAASGRYRPSSDIFPPPFFSKEEAQAAEHRLWQIERATESVLTADGAMYALLQRLGISPQMIVGHSAGEWVAMAAAGILDVDEFVASTPRLAAVYAGLSEDMSIPRAAMLAVGAGRERVHELAAEIDRTVYIANDNCPHQVVVVTEPESADAVVKHLRKKGVFVERLPFDRGYHTPVFTYIVEPLRKYFASLSIQPPRTPLYSCTTGRPYPETPSQILDLVSQTFAQPLRFRDTIESMYADGARLFVEVGPRNMLTGFVGDILRGRPHVAIATDQTRRSGVHALFNALAVMAAMHVPMDPAPLYERRPVRGLSWNPVADRLMDPDNAPGTMQVSLCYPQLELSDGSKWARQVDAAAAEEVAPAAERLTTVNKATSSLEAGTARTPSAAPAPSSPMESLLQQHVQLMRSFLDVHAEVMRGLGGVSLDGTASASTPPAHAVAADPPMSIDPRAEPIQPDGPASVRAAGSPSVSPRLPSHSSASPQGMEEVLLGIVSDKTGYPAEMLGLDLDVEADLGIDSIKRIEILGALQQMPSAVALPSEMDLEAVSKLKTLRQIIAFIEERSAASSAREAAPSQPAPDVESLPLAGRVVRFTPGTEVVVERVMDLEEDRYLLDHCFDPHVTDNDADRAHLHVVPLTVTLEIMAEAASLLMPGLQVIGARSVQAGKWIDVRRHGPEVVLSVVANRVSGRNEVRVSIQKLTTDSPDAKTGPAVAEAVIVFAAEFPAPGPATSLNLEQPRQPVCTATGLYEDRRMFHGPRFHGIVDFDQIGRNGLIADLEVLPNHDVLASHQAPRFFIDPFLLDAAGQLVGYWPIEYLDEGFMMFPIQIQELALYRPSLAVGQRCRCQVLIREITSRNVRADFETIAPDGRVWMRVSGWTDWRFYWPRSFYDFWRFPNRVIVSEHLDLPLPEGFEDVECRRLSSASEIGAGIWEELSAHLVLSESELGEYRAMTEGPVRKQFVFSRAVAKDAVRVWVRRRHGIELYPADIEIAHDDRGRPFVRGPWIRRIGEAPQISISHKDDLAVAAAGSRVIGIDLETVQSREAGFDSLAFDEEERRLLGGFNGDRDEWITRAWCAKEAAGKASGAGLADGPKAMAVRRIEACGQMLVTRGPSVTDCEADRSNGCYVVRSVREGSFVVAVAVEENGHDAA